MGLHLNVPENITIVPLPPKCPELNPQENIWQSGCRRDGNRPTNCPAL
jgi:transposase